MSPILVALKLTTFDTQYSPGFAGVLWLASDGLACDYLQHGEIHMVGSCGAKTKKLNLGQVRLNLAWP